MVRGRKYRVWVNGQEIDYWRDRAVKREVLSFLYDAREQGRPLRPGQGCVVTHYSKNPAVAPVEVRIECVR